VRRALCALAGRFAAVHGWGRFGYSRLGDYACERLGVSARSLQDWAHVESALRELPGLEGSLVSGELGWTKVRLLARVATPGDEAAWLALARAVPARGLAREVRAIDLGARAQPGSPEGDLEGSEEGPREGVSIRASAATQRARHQSFLLARRVSGEAVPLWQAMEWVAAETLSSLALEEDAAEGRASKRRASQGEAVPPAPSCDEVLLPPRVWPVGPAKPAPARRGPVELPSDVARLLAGLDQLGAFTLDRRLRAALALERRLEARIAPLLLRVFEGRHYRDQGFTRFEDYAADRLGFSARHARMLLRLARAARRCPELASAWRSGRLSWMRAHELVPVVALAGGADAGAWIAWAQRVTVRRLREDIVRAIDLAASDPGLWAATGGLPEEVLAAASATAGEAGRDRRELASPDGEPRERQTGAETRAGEATRFYFQAPVVVARLFRAIVCRARRHLERRAGRPVGEDEALRAMFEHFHEVWDVKPPTRQQVFARDGWRCTVPSCSSYRNLHEHHIVYRSRGGSDDLSNRTTLCAWHHLRGVHGGRIRVTGSAPDHLRFELGLREGRRPLLRYDAQERLMGGTTA